MCCAVVLQQKLSVCGVFSYYRMCSLTIECVLLLYNVFSYYTMCSLTMLCSRIAAEAVSLRRGRTTSLRAKPSGRERERGRESDFIRNNIQTSSLRAKPSGRERETLLGTMSKSGRNWPATEEGGVSEGGGGGGGGGGGPSCRAARRPLMPLEVSGM